LRILQDMEANALAAIALLVVCVGVLLRRRMLLHGNPP